MGGRDCENGGERERVNACECKETGYGHGIGDIVCELMHLLAGLATLARLSRFLRLLA